MLSVADFKIFNLIIPPRLIQQCTSVAHHPPIAYLTTIGLYNSSNELLAVAKLSEPLRKDPTNELTLRVRLDY